LEHRQYKIILKMKITIFTIGSRGDVEPFVALGKGLRDSGHIVKIATEARFETLVKEHCLSYAMIPGDTTGVINSEEVQEVLSRKNNTEAFFKHLMTATIPFASQIFEQSIAACEDADHIITTPVCIYLGYFISQKLSKPLTLAAGNAIVASRTKYFHNLFLPPPPDWLPDRLQKSYNYFSHNIMPGLMWKTYHKFYAETWEKVHGTVLPKNDPVGAGLLKKPPLRLYGYSPAFLEKPDDWSYNQYVTGYWFLEPAKSWKPSAKLENFINAGPPPIYIGFGSMNNSLLKNDSLEKLVLGVVRKTKQRAIILNDGLNLDKVELSSNIFATDSVPFTYLFPKMSLIVHHGGAGTTGAALRAGVPSVVTPIIVDQNFWAWRMEKTGVSAKPIAWYKLSETNLSTAISSTLLNQNMHTRAKHLAQRIVGERGIETAVSIFNKVNRY